MKYYTGIGSRETPANIFSIMTQLAHVLDKQGYVLRSGGAEGADSAFEAGSTNKEIYLPWKGFNNNTSNLYMVNPEAFTLAKEFHPAWHRLSAGGRKLMARNMHQVTGKDLQTFSNFVICYTPNGALTGGTAQAIKYAKSLEIEVINLGNKEDLLRIQDYIKENS